MSEFVLFTEWYQPRSEARRAELRRALDENLQCDAIAQVVLFAETRQGLEGTGHHVRVLESSRRPTFADLFRLANREYAGHRIAVANNDISFAFFDPPEFVEDEFLVATRHDWVDDRMVWFDDGDYGIDHGASADAWFFHAPSRVHGAHFRMGQDGCDNRLAWLAHCSGYRVRNVGRECRIAHYHQSSFRPPPQRQAVPPPYLHVWGDGSMKSFVLGGRRDLLHSTFAGGLRTVPFTVSYLFGGRAKV